MNGQVFERKSPKLEDLRAIAPASIQSLERAQVLRRIKPMQGLVEKLPKAEAPPLRIDPARFGIDF